MFPKFESYHAILRLVGSLGILCVVVSRITIRCTISARLGKHSREKWKKICAGQTFREWYFYERFSPKIAPFWEILYQFIMSILTIVLSAVVIVLHFADRELIYLHTASIIAVVYNIAVAIIAALQTRWYKDGRHH